MEKNEKAFRTLEFDKIRALLAEKMPTEGSVDAALSLTPTEFITEARLRQKRTTDAKTLLRAKGMPPFSGVRPMRSICERADKGATLTTRELLDAASLLRTARGMKDYRAQGNLTTSLDEYFDLLVTARPVEEKIFGAILGEDQISDDASKALSDIRRRMRQTNARIKDVLHSFTSGTHAKYLQDAIVTQRGGRYVVPVKAECKNEVKGLIHDTSSSGATIFVEPMAVVEANNELRMLEAEEVKEIDRILATLSADVSSVLSILLRDESCGDALAFCFGCARFSEDLDAAEPILTEERVCKLVSARHPLIDREKVVPIALTLGGETDTVIITGPNTGGKTVTLKTVGLFALMAQSGLHLPCAEGTSLCLFDRVLADIGDEQSIEQSLSTFSSHMVNIISVLGEATDRSLCLFDELGAGTDPVEGAALAVSVIEEVRLRGSLCLSTTHYTELKTYALETDGVQNASCEFDVETLRPTYKLLVGVPGKSNAFAISEKLGMPASVIRRAESHVGDGNKSFEKTIGMLEEERQKAEAERSAALAELAGMRKRLRESEEKARADASRAEKLLSDAEEKARQMVESARATADFVFARMEKLQKEEDAKVRARELEEARKEVRESLRVGTPSYVPSPAMVADDYVLPRVPEVGETVFCVSLGRTATVTSKPDKSERVAVSSGPMKLKVPLSDVRLCDKDGKLGGKMDVPAKQKSDRFGSSSGKKDFSEVKAFFPEIDLRGLTGDEAWAEVDKFFDDAVLAGFSSLRLIHGKGTGALKTALWKYLRSDRRIASFRLGQYGEGDGGVTVVELK